MPAISESIATKLLGEAATSFQALRGEVSAITPGVDQGFGRKLFAAAGTLQKGRDQFIREIEAVPGTVRPVDEPLHADILRTATLSGAVTTIEHDALVSPASLQEVIGALDGALSDASQNARIATGLLGKAPSGLGAGAIF